ncbi:MAG: hypothetical protein KF787_00540 [Phycisphaeraceae bacterium]|nr:hypothetical protein [Phycisphaeraceae bacterium]
MPEQFFKTLYFPADRSRSGRPARVTVSVPLGAAGDVAEFVRSASSRELRQALGDPVLEDVEAQAAKEGRSLSNTVVHLLLEAKPTRRVIGTASDRPQQLELSFGGDGSSKNGESDVRALGVTFQETRRHPVHRWYPYVEGFSATYVRDTLMRDGRIPKSVYDPFGGAGTTMLTASALGVSSYYSEINPLMVFVADAKTRCAHWARTHYERFCKTANHFTAAMTKREMDRRGAHVDVAAIDRAFPERDFFDQEHLRHLLAARDLARDIATEEPESGAILLLACAANAVGSSHMTRRADLRRRRSDEYQTRVVDVPASLRKSVEEMTSDILALPETMAPTTFLSPDCRMLSEEHNEQFDFALTSPPYLNGTNYFRNTKIELWLLGLIAGETELARFRTQTICAGINDVNGGRAAARQFERVELVASKLDVATKDRRIPALVRHYFSDMHAMFAAVHRCLKPDARFVLDIGDSRFYGVHVPTDELLQDVAREAGFEIEHTHLLARRRSRDSSSLVQVEIVFRKPRQRSRPPSRNALERAVDQLSQSLPYRSQPFASRSWGHGLHSLCSYQGKFKPAIAHWLVRTFVPKGGAVLDPLGGVGTVAFEAALAGAWAVSNDKSPFASTIAAAKLMPPSLDAAEAALEGLAARMQSVRLVAADKKAAEFGLNGAVSAYYHPETLEEVLRARKVFAEDPGHSSADKFIWASVLHILHGNRPYALSRTSHPVTPFNPSGPFIYKSLIEKTRDRVRRALREQLPPEFRPGVSHHGDFRELPARYADRFDAVITSPPFIGMRFDRPNWLRLWFCGWTEADFHVTSQGYLERQQTRSMDCYREFYDATARMIRRGGTLVVHLGSGGRDRMLERLIELGSEAFTFVRRIDEDVSDVEKHGIRDKGMTSAQHFLVFRR